MSHNQGLTTWCPPAPRVSSTGVDLAGVDRPRPRPSFHGSDVRVLIQVPAVRSVPSARRPSRLATERARRYGSTPPPRRRLRKEIRAAAYLLGAATPLALAVVLLLGLPVARGLAPEAADEGFAPPSIRLTIEALSAVPGSTAAEPLALPPVNLPGYLLPDDGIEEPAHAGG